VQLQRCSGINGVNDISIVYGVDRRSTADNTCVIWSSNAMVIATESPQTYKNWI
jgi:hypothetical protein